MADAALTPTLVDQWDDGKRLHVVVSIAIAAGDYVATGLTLNLSTLGILATGLPIWSACFGDAPTGGYEYPYTPGTSLADGKLVMFGQQPTAGAGILPLDELAVAALVAGAVADVLSLYLIFKKF